MTPELKNEFVRLLKSNKYKIGKGRLFKQGCYCPLGMIGVEKGLTLSESGYSFQEDDNSINKETTYPALEELGIPDADQRAIYIFNDQKGGHTNEEVAEFISQYL